jgi:predicted ATP-dependent endonuclease of OLD family
MFRIAEVHIDGFWGALTADVKLHPDVNIFIGKNGTGKTTLIDAIYAALKADLDVLFALEFSKLTITLRDSNRTRTIKVTKSYPANTPYGVIEYAVGTHRFKLVSMLSGPPSRISRVSPRLAKELEALQLALESLVNISSLSVHRMARLDNADDEEPYSRSRRDSSPPIDRTLQQLLLRLTKYQLTLAEQAAAVSSNFQKQVFLLMLFDPQLDAKLNFEAQDVASLSSEFARVYEQLGAVDDVLKAKVQQHMDEVPKRATRFIEAVKSKTDIKLEDIFAIPLLRRTTKMVELYSSAQEEKRNIFLPIETFQAILSEFFTDKKVEITSAGEIEVIKTARKVPHQRLSSGEKQLLIQLIEALLQQGRFFIFIADEPELSLHVEWQSKILDAIKRLNPATQVIVATHSPEIAAGRSESIIDMEDVISG